jgi:transcriptional regulator with XRE-family HTH domain
MLNTDDFIKRMEFIMDHFGLSASSFADKISVQRSSISHLLSGRNKPSLDFILKILAVFPELNLYWFLDGSGSYLKNDDFDLTLNKKEIASTPTLQNEEKNSNEIFKTDGNSESKTENYSIPPQAFLNKMEGKQIEKIVCFYTDGTFTDYNPNRLK